jgi:hypothetical protein
MQTLTIETLAEQTAALGRREKARKRMALAEICPPSPARKAAA